MLKIQCPHCGTSFALEENLVGRKVQCDECECRFLVPRPGEAAPILSGGKAAPLPAGRRRRGIPAVALALVLAGAGAASVALLRQPKTAAAPAQPAPDGILHQWNFDEDFDWHDAPIGAIPPLRARIVDLPGGWDAAPAGPATPSRVSGPEFMALRLPENGAWLDIGHDLGPVLGRTASLGFWCRTRQPGADRADSAPGICGTVAERARNAMQWAWLDAYGHMVLSAGPTTIARTPRPVNDGRWHCIVFTRNAETGRGQAFVDGEAGDSQDGPKGAFPQDFRSIGRLETPGGDAPCFDGDLDKLTVFDCELSLDDADRFRANHAPKAWDVDTEGSAGAPFVTGSVFARAYDAEHDPLTVRRWTPPRHGTVAYNGDGSFTYTPRDGFTGPDAFEVVVADARGGYHLSAMQVRIVDEPPDGGIPVVRFRDHAEVAAGPLPIRLGGMRVPRGIDWNGDGLRDLLVGANGGVIFYRNTGGTNAPAFAPGVPVRAGGAELRSGDGPCPIALADMNGDGKTDLVFSDRENRLLVCHGAAVHGIPPIAAPVAVCDAAGEVFKLNDRRFDLGDWDGDGRVDLVVGAYSGAVTLYRNTGTRSVPRFGEGEPLFSGSYNLYPRLCDLNGNGDPDLVYGINWGDVTYRLDVRSPGPAHRGKITVTDAREAPLSLRPGTDGAIVDVADMNGDGVLDLLVGGHAGDRLFVATGTRADVGDFIRQLDGIYAAHPDNLGEALSADDNRLLGKVNQAQLGLAGLIENGTPAMRSRVYERLAAHVGKHPFLRYQELDVARYHHVPSIALQNWVMLRYARPDTPKHRADVAEVMGLHGTTRDIYLASGLALGDNGRLNEAQRGAVRDFMRHHPRALFPDCLITFDQLYGDGRGGLVWTPDSCKNTFGCDVGPANEWARDLTAAIEAVQGPGAAHGDYFTFVMGHEVTHSLDGYVNARANRDLRRRWGLMLCRAAGPDVLPGENGWPDWEATRQHFRQRGRYAPDTQSWDDAWKTYWERGPGKAFRHTSFMRGGIDWFLGAPQESLATQANHHWANGQGRLIGAVARFRRGVETGNEPEKANLTEVVDFIDYLSAGMNRVALPQTTVHREPGKNYVAWTSRLADLVRDDRGRIRRIVVDGTCYDFTLDADGAVADVSVTPDAAGGSR